MDENSLLIPVAMKIIMNSGNARTKANEALEALSIFDFSNAHKKIVEAREDIKKSTSRTNRNNSKRGCR